MNAQPITLAPNLNLAPPLGPEGLRAGLGEEQTDGAQPKFRLAPFPWFGGKRQIAAEVWERLGSPTQYIEPFCGSAAVLLAARQPASLEVVNDMNFYIANFWRAIRYQPEAVASEQDYPVSHVDLHARHRWLTEPARTAALCAALEDAEWPGDARMAGWWVWGQCCWIGAGWCEKEVPAFSDAGQGVQSQIPQISDAGRGVQSQIPHISDAGQGVQSKIPHSDNSGVVVHSGGRDVLPWFLQLRERLRRCRVLHGDWTRCLNHNYGGANTAVFLDPPYKGFEQLYNKECREPVADAVARWAAAHAELRVALCGLAGDYDLPGWSTLCWKRGRLTYGGAKTTSQEVIWFSPACLSPACVLLPGLDFNSVPKQTVTAENPKTP